MVHGTVKVVHGTVNLKMVHGTVEFVVHGTVKVVHGTVTVHGTVKMVHGTVVSGAWDGQLFEQISLFLLAGKSWCVGACGTLYYKGGSICCTLLVSMGISCGGQSCDPSALFQ